MGCQCSRLSHDKTKSFSFLQTQVGLLDVQITNGQLYDKKLYEKIGSGASVFLRIQVSNQDYLSRTCSNFTNDGFFNSYFSFFINSNYRANGRILQIQLHKKNQGFDSEVLGKSIVDISKLIGVQQTKQQMKCILNNKKEPLGFVNCILTFNPMDYKTVSFRFASFILRKESLCGYKSAHPQLRVEILLGEECLSTSTSKDMKNEPASWLNDIMTFKVPNLLKFGKITVYEDNRIFGETVIKIQQLIAIEEYHEICCFSQLFDGNDIEVGSIKYSIIIGRNPKFSKQISKNAENINPPHLKASRQTSIKPESFLQSKGVEIMLKDRFSASTLGEEIENDTEEKNKNLGNKVCMGGSLRCFSVFSIEDLSKMQKNSDK